MPEVYQEIPRNELRYEVKFTAAPTTLPWIDYWIRSNSAGFREPYAARWVNSAYFDSHSYHAYGENLSGVSSKKKVRLRWYGDVRTDEEDVLEIKMRCNELGRKFSVRLDPPLDMESQSWRQIVNELHSRVPGELRPWLDYYTQPVLVTRYFRKYLVSANRFVRLTIDMKQAAFDQTRSIYPNLARRLNLPNVIVVEFKFAPGARSYASEIIRNIPMRRSRNSKYIVGVNSLV